jgi:hypothetical protein
MKVAMLDVLLELRAASHYGRPSREVVGLNGQTSLRVRRNGLRITNKIQELKPSAGHSVKPPKASIKVQREEEHPTLFLSQNNPSNLTSKIMPIFIFEFFL